YKSISSLPIWKDVKKGKHIFSRRIVRFCDLQSTQAQIMSRRLSPTIQNRASHRERSILQTCPPPRSGTPTRVIQPTFSLPQTCGMRGFVGFAASYVTTGIFTGRPFVAIASKRQPLLHTIDFPLAPQPRLRGAFSPRRFRLAPAPRRLAVRERP